MIIEDIKETYVYCGGCAEGATVEEADKLNWSIHDKRVVPDGLLINVYCHSCTKQHNSMRESRAEDDK